MLILDVFDDISDPRGVNIPEVDIKWDCLSGRVGYQVL
jgi:hypothetical protein